MKQTLTLLLVCIYSFSPFLGLEGLVLCYGDDGHVEVEIAYNGNCGSNFSARTILHNQSDNKSNTLGAVQSDHCGRCVDVPLVPANRHSFRTYTDTSTGKTNRDHPGVVLHFLDPYPKNTPSVQLRGQLYSTSSSLESIHSVVLLI